MHQLSGFVLFTALLVACSGQAFAITLKIATLAPAGTSWMKEMKNGARLITEKTGGRVKVKFYPAGVMGSEPVVLRKIKLGQLHGGAFSSAALSGLYPDIQSLSIPMLFDSLDEVDYVRERFEPLIAENLAASDFVLLGVGETGFSYLMSQAPMRDLDAVKSSKLWAPQGDRMAREALLSMGLSPVVLPFADVYAGLQTGLLETVMTTHSAAIAFQWFNSAEYMTEVPLAYLLGYLTVHKRAFDKISPEDQAIVREAFAQAFDTMDIRTREDNIKARLVLENNGIKFVRPDEAELAHWRKLAEQSVPQLVEKGTLTRAGVDRVLRLRQAYRSQQAQYE